MGGRTLALNPPRATATLRAYRGLSRALAPWLLGWLWWRGRREPGYRDRLGERLGHLPIDPGRFGGLWLHASEQLHHDPGIAELRELLVDLVPPTPSHSVPPGSRHSANPYAMSSVPPLIA